MAFNSKNLHYDKQEPTFLRRLKGEFSGLDGRHNVQIARPKKDRLKTGDEDEDDPVIVDEQGERIEKAEFERRVNGEDSVQAPVVEKGPEDGEEKRKHGSEQDKETDRQKVSEAGASSFKKRKVAKVVGGEDGGNRESTTDYNPNEKSNNAQPMKKTSAPPKTKAKKIKLSFDEPDG